MPALTALVTAIVAVRNGAPLLADAKACQISVIVPVWNGARYLAEAMDSILRQTLPVDEIVVVDDGSTDATAKIARSFGDVVRYVYQANQGLGSALNTGIAESRGSLLSFLAADDTWSTQKTELQAAALERDPLLDAVMGKAENFISPDVEPERAARFVYPKGPVVGLTLSAMLFRREVFTRVGPFETSRRVGEFAEWWSRAIDASVRHGLIPQIVLNRRIHGGNLSLTADDYAGDMLRTVRQILLRRRGSS